MFVKSFLHQYIYSPCCRASNLCPAFCNLNFYMVHPALLSFGPCLQAMHHMVLWKLEILNSRLDPIQRHGIPNLSTAQIQQIPWHSWEGRTHQYGGRFISLLTFMVTQVRLRTTYLAEIGNFLLKKKKKKKVKS